jgi:ABC-type multidrug transport system fused ATPase/permease subunit
MDAVLSLPQRVPLPVSPDGSIRVQNAAFGWPTKPPRRYTVDKSNTSWNSSTDGSGDSLPALSAGDVVESADAQVRKMTQISTFHTFQMTLTAGILRFSQASSTEDLVKVTHGGNEGWLDASVLTALPDPPLEDWPAPSPAIAGVDLDIPAGELVLISGPVNAGKSSLLESLVGNTELLDGSLAVPSIAFQPQTPILFDTTIRANILFGVDEASANEAFMQRSLVASTLASDMTDPDSTLHAKREYTACGQGGSELSGGQQARVALARCIYASLAGSETIILDDPLKALDPVTAEKCWNTGIKGTLSGKTRVIVLNSQMVSRFASDNAVNRLIIVDGGQIAYNGEPGLLPKELQTRLGDGYATGTSSLAVRPRDASSVKQRMVKFRFAAKLAGQKHKLFAVDEESVEETAELTRQSTQMMTGANDSAADKSTDDAEVEVAQLTARQKRAKHKQALSDLAELCTGKIPTLAEYLQKVSTDIHAESLQLPSLTPTEWATFGQLLNEIVTTTPTTAAKGANIADTVLSYSRHQGAWFFIATGASVLAQLSTILVFQWNEYWASNYFGLSRAKNFGVAVGLFVFSQSVSLLQAIGQDFGAQAASRNIRLAMQKKLGALAMPYLWAPGNSVASMCETATKDPSEFAPFAQVPVICARSMFSMATIIFAKPLIAPAAGACLYLRKLTKSAFGWALRQVIGGLGQEDNVRQRKLVEEQVEGAATITAMGRQREFQTIVNADLYQVRNPFPCLSEMFSNGFKTQTNPGHRTGRIVNEERFFPAGVRVEPVDTRCLEAHELPGHARRHALGIDLCGGCGLNARQGGTGCRYCRVQSTGGAQHAHQVSHIL